MVKDYQRFFRNFQLVWVGPRCPRCFKMGRNRYGICMAWAPKARRPTSKSTHVRPSSPSVWSNHILCSFYFEFSNLSNVQILLIGHVDQVFHKFCGAIPPSLMFFVLNFHIFPNVQILLKGHVDQVFHKGASQKKIRDFLGVFPKCRTPPTPPIWEASVQKKI